MAEKKSTTKKKTKAKAAPKKKAVAKAKPAKSEKTPKKTAAAKFAVIEIAGSQLEVEAGKKYTIKKIEGEKGESITTEKVLLISDGKSVKLGKPYVDGATVTMTIDSQKLDKKVDTFKYKAKTGYRRNYGQRAEITRIHVTSIG